MKKLERDDAGKPVFPTKVPDDANEILMLMDDAAAYAKLGQGVTSPTFDHGMRLFNQLNAHYQISVARKLAKAHECLASATEALKVATWWLAGITVLLGGIEILKIFTH